MKNQPKDRTEKKSKKELPAAAYSIMISLSARKTSLAKPPETHSITPTIPTMKVKNRFSPITNFALVTLFASSVASAAAVQSLIFGFHDFDGTPDTESADFATAGVSAEVVKGANVTSSATGGTTDNFYGNTSVAVFGGTNPTQNDGYLILAPGATATFSVQANSGSLSLSFTMDRFLYDVATAVGTEGTLVMNAYLNSSASAFATRTTTVDTEGSTTDYQDVRVNNVQEIVFGDLIEILFQNTGSSVLYLDNIAALGTELALIPEPGSMLALGCILTSGLAMRNRRRAVKAS